MPGTAELGGSDAQSGDGITVDPRDTPAEGTDPCPVDPPFWLSDFSW
jgi:hypothetical protein